MMLQEAGLHLSKANVDGGGVNDSALRSGIWANPYACDGSWLRLTVLPSCLRRADCSPREFRIPVFLDRGDSDPLRKH